MTISHSTPVRNAATDTVVDRLDLGTTNPSARLALLTAGDVLVVAAVASNPAFGNSVGGTATANALTAGTVGVGAAGTVAKFEWRDRDNAKIWGGTVGVSGADMNISNVVFAEGDQFPNLAAAPTYTALPV